MLCPKCKSDSLKATRFDEGLLGFSCTACKGTLISLTHYREWAERMQEPMDESMVRTASIAPPSTKTAMCCPKCNRLMLKYRISGGTNNMLDVCTSWDVVWLDSGEWRLLKHLRLSGNMPKIFTDSWQRRVRKDISERHRREKLRQLIGDQGLAKAEDLRAWLKNNPHRSQILFYLNHE